METVTETILGILAAALIASPFIVMVRGKLPFEKPTPPDAPAKK